MTGSVDIPGVILECALPTAKNGAETWAHHLKLTLPGLCEVVSSAPLNGGFGLRHAVVNRSVHKDRRCDDPEADMKHYVTRLGLAAETTVGLITAVGMSDLHYVGAERSGWRVHALVTAGVGNAAAAGGKFTLAEARAGTVNIVVLLEGSLSPAALVGAVQSVTEAKTAAFRKRNVTTRFGEPATGTTTDTVTIVNLGGKRSSPYAGLATVPGFLVADTVYTALLAALH